MKNNNLKMAEEYSRRIKAITAKVWVSDNLPQMPAEERRAILKVYRKHFHTVEYDPITGICKCWVIPPEADLQMGSVLEIASIDTAHSGGTANAPLKQSTRDLLGIGEPDEHHLWIDNSDQMPGTQH